MKYNARPVTFSLFVDAIKHRWKTILLTTMLFALIGTGAAFLFAGQGAADADGFAEPLEVVELDAVIRNEKYYNAGFDLLKTGFDNLYTYVGTLQEDHTLSDAQKDALEQQMLLLQDFSFRFITPLCNVCADPYAALVPVELLDDYLRSCRNALAQAHLDLISSKAASEFISQIDSPYVTTKDMDNVYQTLFLTAAEYGFLLKNEECYQQIVFRLENDREDVESQIREFDRNLTTAIGQFQSLQEQTLALLNEICLENALLLKIDPKNTGCFAPMVTHTHTAASRSEAFAIIVLFTTLVGLCSGSFLAVCIEARKKDPQEPIPSVSVSE